MSKLAIGLLACAGVALAGCATQTTPTQTAQAKRDAEYNAAVKKCDDLSVAERSECIYDARQRYGKS
jgi:uncharacterized protein YceK